MSIASDITGQCDSYCKHGGVCTLEKGHKGKHNSNYCTWDKKESLTKEEADKLLEDKIGVEMPNTFEILKALT